MSYKSLEKEREYRKEYYQRNREKLRDYSKQYYQKNKEKWIKYSKTPERKKWQKEYDKKYYKQHQKHENRYHKEYRKNKYEKIRKLFGNKCCICGFDRMLMLHEIYGKEHIVSLKYYQEHKDDFALTCFFCHKGIHFCMKHLGLSFNQILELHKSFGKTS